MPYELDRRFSSSNSYLPLEGIIGPGPSDNYVKPN